MGRPMRGVERRRRGGGTLDDGGGRESAGVYDWQDGWVSAPLQADLPMFRDGRAIAFSKAFVSIYRLPRSPPPAVIRRCPTWLLPSAAGSLSSPPRRSRR